MGSLSSWSRRLRCDLTRIDVLQGDEPSIVRVDAPRSQISYVESRKFKSTYPCRIWPVCVLETDVWLHGLASCSRLYNI